MLGSVMKMQGVQYFLAMYPFLVSLGMGGSVIGVLYFLFDFIWGKIKAKFYCSVRIKYDDDTFKWVNKYMQDAGLIADDT